MPGVISHSYSDFPNLPNDFLTVIDITEDHLNYSIQKYLPNQSAALPLAVKILNDIRIVITDEANQEVDLNGQHTNFTFVIQKLD
jgi:ABC-type antimicrobial peptide transport system ATPase subunit